MKTLFLKGLLSRRIGGERIKGSANYSLEFLNLRSPTLREQHGVTGMLHLNSDIQVTASDLVINSCVILRKLFSLSSSFLLHESGMLLTSQL